MPFVFNNLAKLLILLRLGPRNTACAWQAVTLSQPQDAQPQPASAQDIRQYPCSAQAVVGRSAVLKTQDLAVLCFQQVSATSPAQDELD